MPVGGGRKVLDLGQASTRKLDRSSVPRRVQALGGASVGKFDRGCVCAHWVKPLRQLKVACLVLPSLPVKHLAQNQPPGPQLMVESVLGSSQKRKCFFRNLNTFPLSVRHL